MAFVGIALLNVTAFAVVQWAESNPPEPLRKCSFVPEDVVADAVSAAGVKPSQTFISPFLHCFWHAGEAGQRKKLEVHTGAAAFGGGNDRFRVEKAEDAAEHVIHPRSGVGDEAYSWVMIELGRPVAKAKLRVGSRRAEVVLDQEAEVPAAEMERRVVEAARRIAEAMK